MFTLFCRLKIVYVSDSTAFKIRVSTMTVVRGTVAGTARFRIVHQRENGEIKRYAKVKKAKRNVKYILYRN